MLDHLYRGDPEGGLGFDICKARTYLVAPGKDGDTNTLGGLYQKYLSNRYDNKIRTNRMLYCVLAIECFGSSPLNPLKFDYKIRPECLDDPLGCLESKSCPLSQIPSAAAVDGFASRLRQLAGNKDARYNLGDTHYGLNACSPAPADEENAASD